MEVYNVAAVERRKLTHACRLLCVELQTKMCEQPRRKNNFPILQYTFHFVRIKYTSNMATCHNNDVNDVTAHEKA